MCGADISHKNIRQNLLCRVSGIRANFHVMAMNLVLPSPSRMRESVNDLFKAVSYDSWRLCLCWNATR